MQQALGPDGHPIPRWEFRRYAGAADAAALYAVRLACADADGYDPFSSEDDIPSAAQIAQQLDVIVEPQANVLVVEGNGRVIGYSYLVWWAEQDGTRLYLHQGWLVPAWRGRGIGTAMLRWAEARLRRIAGEAAAGIPVYGANAADTERDATALLLAEGYQPAFTLIEMSLDDPARVTAAPLPSGFTLRRVSPADYHAIWLARHTAYADSPFAELPDEDEYRRWVAHADPTHWWAAWDGDQVAGMALCAIARGRGEVLELNVAKPYRQRGLGHALLTHGVRELAAAGAPFVRLHTNKANIYASYELYERTGFRTVKEYVRYRKPMHPVRRMT